MSAAVHSRGARGANARQIVCQIVCLANLLLHICGEVQYNKAARICVYKRRSLFETGKWFSESAAHVLTKSHRKNDRGSRNTSYATLKGYHEIENYVHSEIENYLDLTLKFLLCSLDSHDNLIRGTRRVGV